MMSSFRDPARFDVYVDILQRELGWEDRVLLLEPHLEGFHREWLGRPLD